MKIQTIFSTFFKGILYPLKKCWLTITAEPQFGTKLPAELGFGSTSPHAALRGYGIFALLFFGVLLSACGGDNKPAGQDATGRADTTQIAAPPAPLKLDFEHFGNYDLSTWNVKPPKTEAGGDVVLEVLV